jgi:hypothetical protein
VGVDMYIYAHVHVHVCVLVRGGVDNLVCNW